MARNVPPVVGAIVWSRQLLRHIEEPIRILHNNQIATNLRDYSRIVKTYNKLAASLIKFESVWTEKWKLGIERTTDGLHATLFVTDTASRKLIVNADEK